MLLNNCLGGIPAAAFWNIKLNLGLDLDFRIVKDKIIVKIPKGARISIYADEPEKVIHSYAKGKPARYRALLDKLPAKWIFNMGIGTDSASIDNTAIDPHKVNTEIELFDNKGELFVCEGLDGFSVMGLYGVMLYMLINWIFTDGYSYENILETFYNAILEDFNADLSYFPTKVLFYGAYNWSHSYLVNMKKQLLAAEGDIEAINQLLPKNAYPERGQKINAKLYEFDPQKSEILNNAGDAD
jgi:hypothetical protein